MISSSVSSWIVRQLERLNEKPIAKGLERYWRTEDVYDIIIFLGAVHTTAPSVPEERGPCFHESPTASHVRTVWILGRPLSHALTVSTLAESSVGKYHVNHWGVLITDRVESEVQKILSQKQTGRCSQTTDSILGHVVELSRDYEGNNTVNITTPFMVKHLVAWPMVSASVVGQTTKSNHEIEMTGSFYSQSC